MSLTTRRILYVSFIIAFLTIAPMAIFYAAGYKFNLKQGLKLEKTGALILDSKPKGGRILINGKPAQPFLARYFSRGKNYYKTPVKIKNLTPGEYNIRIEYEGYLPWEKKLKIEPNTSAYAEDVLLFKQSLPIAILPDKIKAIELSPDRKKIAVLFENELVIINMADNALKTMPLRTDSRPKTMQWFQDNKNILLDYYIYNINNQEILNLKQLIGSDTELIKWGDTNQILYSAYSCEVFDSAKKCGINSFDIMSKTEKNLLKAKFKDYLIKDDKIYLIGGSNGQSRMETISIETGQILRTINLHGSDDYKFINGLRDYVNLYDQANNLLYIIDSLSTFSPLLETVNNVKSIYPVNENVLLYANDFEIWFLDARSGEKNLITRISQEIKSLARHPDGNYIFYSTGDAIYALELDERDKRNVAEIAKLNKISNIFISPSGDTLYFSAAAGQQEGLYSLEIN